jgi:penicillin-binding protein-related factor A (putative recombinase)
MNYLKMVKFWTIYIIGIVSFAKILLRMNNLTVYIVSPEAVRAFYVTPSVVGFKGTIHGQVIDFEHKLEDTYDMRLEW